jgi:dTDP-4-dehydrorhamnose reductase
LVVLSHQAESGIIHATSQGECSWLEFAAAIFELSGVAVELRSAASSDFPAKAPRPAYSVLANRELNRRSVDVMPHWRDALEVYLEEISERRLPTSRTS